MNTEKKEMVVAVDLFKDLRTSVYWPLPPEKFGHGMMIELR